MKTADGVGSQPPISRGFRCCPGAVLAAGPIRRFARLINAHGKPAARHEAMISIFVAWYNFCRKNESLKKQTPAMSSRLIERIWSIEG
jgi:hypothetical protein